MRVVSKEKQRSERSQIFYFNSNILIVLIILIILIILIVRDLYNLQWNVEQWMGIEI